MIMTRPVYAFKPYNVGRWVIWTLFTLVLAVVDAVIAAARIDVPASVTSHANVNSDVFPAVTLKGDSAPEKTVPYWSSRSTISCAMAGAIPKAAAT